VLKLSGLQGNVKDPGPFLDATAVVVAAKQESAGWILPRNALSGWERSVWEVLDELEACCFATGARSRSRPG
jgi:hypothetical protein